MTIPLKLILTSSKNTPLKYPWMEKDAQLIIFASRDSGEVSNMKKCISMNTQLSKSYKKPLQTIWTRTIKKDSILA